MKFFQIKCFSTPLLIMCCLLSVALPLSADDVFTTQPLVNEIKTLRVIADGDFMKLPVIDAESILPSTSKSTSTSTSEIEISFDYLSDEQPWLTYSIVHCDRNWEQDDLSEMDYADGFFPVRITDVQPSFNTFVPYFHFRIKFPNEDVRLQVSGNYAVLIHPEDDEDEILAVATFSVSEQLAFAGGEISPNTDVDFKKSHQQVNLSVTWGQRKLPYLDPVNELHVMACQNRRFETLREVSVPTIIEAGRVTYEHNSNLIFKAGNQYRRFEFTDERYASLGVDNIRYVAPHYVATLRLDQHRNTLGYRYDKDQKGRFLVHALRVGDEDTEAEYFIALFTLMPSSNILQHGPKDVFIDGDFTYGQKTEDFEMYYEEESGLYCRGVVLKQGAYNYQYLVDGETELIEGDYCETENEYDVYIYYHPSGSRYDRLLGVAKIE